MAEIIKKVKIKKADGTFSSPIPIGASAENITLSDGTSLQTAVTELINGPAILSGTTEPLSTQGKNGDIYILHM